MAVSVRHQFVGLFGGGIQADRMIDAISDRKRDLSIRSIDRTRRRIGQVRDLLMPTAFEYVYKADQIGIHISVRIRQ